MMGYLWIWRWCYWHRHQADYLTVKYLSSFCCCLLFAHWPNPSVCSNSSKSPFLPQMLGICEPISWRDSQELCTLSALLLWTLVLCSECGPNSLPSFQLQEAVSDPPLPSHSIFFYQSANSWQLVPRGMWAGFCLLPVLTHASKGLLAGLRGTRKLKIWDNSVQCKKSCWTWVVEPLGHCRLWTSATLLCSGLWSCMCLFAICLFSSGKLLLLLLLK